MTAVSLRGVGKAYGDKDAATFAALRDVDLDVETGEFLVLTGRSGCGKTTLLNIIGGLELASSGVVRVDRAVVSRPGAGKGMVFQQAGNRLHAQKAILEWLFE